MTRVSLIVAHDEGGVIAVNGRIPWDLPEERSYFRRVTNGGAVIMGARTWETIREPLPGRINVVLTKYIAFVGKGPAWVATSLDAAFGMAEHETENVFVIGGAEVYRTALDAGVVERIYATEVHARYDGADVRRFEMPAGWRCVEKGMRRAATGTRPAWTPRVWRRP